jgi:DNA invertase Pin-like site-specific DNA recombinase
VKPLRSAVYTRKSTEDGLEQEFNSLDAQRDACEAYVLSQRHEGWSLVSNRYDDGGFSGGNMERPGLKALLADVEAGLVDVIVVYKVDRLTRSLADFAKIVERLDAKEASFVSVTQAFNTTTSMGRLTLNVLLSFAQFEREVTGERIRDKIAASKKKGLWMGGPVPLGYQVVDRKLFPVPDEAERVRTIMRRYIASTSANQLIAQLEAEGIVTKIQQRTSGPHRGGIPFRRGSLFYLLKNPVYRGKIIHKGKAYDGEHQPVVDEELWQQVQDRLAAKAPPRKRPTNEPQLALLRGLLIDPEGRPMVPTYGSKGKRRYAYYESRKDLARKGDPAATRSNRGSLDKHIIDCVGDFLEDEHALRRTANIVDAAQLRSLFEQARDLRSKIADLRTVGVTLRLLVMSIHFRKDELEVTLDPHAMGVPDQPSWMLLLPRPSRAPFREAKLKIDVVEPDRPFDPQIVRLIAEALQVQRTVLAAPHLSLNQLANREGRCRKQMAKLLRASWLSPQIIESIVTGSQPRSFNRQRLLEAELPVDWSEQEKVFGFA